MLPLNICRVHMKEIHRTVHCLRNIKFGANPIGCMPLVPKNDDRIGHTPPNLFHISFLTIERRRAIAMRSNSRLLFVSALLLCISFTVNGKFKTRERGGHDTIAQTATWANTVANEKVVGGSHLKPTKGDRQVQTQQQRQTRQRRHGMEPPNGSADFMNSFVFHTIDEVPQEPVAADDADSGKKVKALARIGILADDENSDKDGRSKGVNSEDTDSLDQDDAEGTKKEGKVGKSDDPLADDQAEESDGKFGTEPAGDVDGDDDDDSKGTTEMDQHEGHPEHGDDDDGPDSMSGGKNETSAFLRHSQTGDDDDAGNTTGQYVGTGENDGGKGNPSAPNAKGESSEQSNAVAKGSEAARSKAKGSKKARKEKNKKVDNKSKQYRPTTVPQYDPSLSNTPSMIMPDEPSTAPVVLTVVQGRPSAVYSAKPTVSAPDILPPIENEPSARPSSTPTEFQITSEEPRASPSSEPTDLESLTGSIASAPIAFAFPSPGPSSFVTSQEVNSPTLTLSPNPTIDSPSSMPSCLQEHDCTRSVRPV